MMLNRNEQMDLVATKYGTARCKAAICKNTGRLDKTSGTRSFARSSPMIQAKNHRFELEISFRLKSCALGTEGNDIIMKRFGIVGAGIIATSHKRALQGNSSCELIAVCDIVAEKAEQIAEGTNARVYTDYKVMQEAEQLDAVILNLPHFLHKEVSIYFLERRIAVLVEKPMANSVEECDAMIEASKKTKTPLAIGHVQRYYESYRKLKELIENETLGKLCLMTETRNVDYFNEKRPRWFLNKKQAGGGIVMNYGAHTLDKLFYTTGLKVESVTAAGQNLLTDDDVEATAQIFLKLSGGVSAAFTYCGCHVPSQYDTYFYFTDGVAHIRGGLELWISERGSEFQKADLDFEKDTFVPQLEEFLKLMDGEESEAVTPEYGREVISVLERAFRQIEG